MEANVYIIEGDIIYVYNDIKVMCVWGLNLRLKIAKRKEKNKVFVCTEESGVSGVSWKY